MARGQVFDADHGGPTMAAESKIFTRSGDRLDGDVHDRFLEVVARCDGYLNDDRTSARADCPWCGMSGCLTVFLNEDSVGLNCNSRSEAMFEGGSRPCDPWEICLAINVDFMTLSLSKSVPPAPDLSGPLLKEFVMLRPELLAVTGSVNDALVLERLLYWWPKSGLPVYEGRRWVAKFNEELAVEVGITASTLRQTVIPHLIDLGFIVKRIGGWKGKKCPWYSIEVETLEAAVAEAVEALVDSGMKRYG